MLELARIERGVTPARINFPRPFNAAYDLLVRQLEAGRGDHVVYRDDTTERTYAQLFSDIQRAAGMLLGRGLEPEQRVMLLMLDTVAFPAMFLGAIYAGLVPIPINTMLTTADYRFLLRDSRARALIVSDVLVPKVEPALADAPLLRHVFVARSPLGSASAPSPHPSLEDALARATPRDAPAETCADEPAFWLYSSGSTGQPKGAIHLHRNLLQTAVLYGQGVLGIRPDDVVFSAAKLFFAYGLGNALTFPLSVGASAVLMAERPTPASVLRVMRQHQPTIFGGVPTLFASILADPNAVKENASARLRISTSAGEALPRHIGEAWRARFGSDILDGIGSTEMLHIFISNRVGDVRYGTTGFPVPGYEVKLVGDDGAPVPDGEEGSLWVSGPSCAVAYWNNREKNLATFHGPWTRTGDRYVRNADGTFTYCGRADDMIKVSGMWVSPFEVESALAAHEAVLEAAVVGHEDQDGLTKPRAWLVLKDPAAASPALAEELKAFVKNRLAPYKYPRWIEFVSALPKTATGKIQRFKLRGVGRDSARTGPEKG